MDKNRNTFHVSAPASLDTIETDPIKLKQILLNLLSNAAKFTENGEVFLEVALTEGEEPSWVEFKVRDTGIGMDEHTQEQLFNSFFQADTSSKRKFGGTGLGLTISRHFASMLGGSISVASAPGQGTEFTVHLPLHVSITKNVASL
jgi:signal transduction histidine kinase